MNLPTNWKPIAGWICLILSVCCMATYMTLPFSGLSLGTIAKGVITAMILGKVLFFSAVYLLGKPYMNQLKSRFLGRKKTDETPTLGDNDNVI